MRMRLPRLPLLIAVWACITVCAAACGGTASSQSGTPGPNGAKRTTLHLGYLANITHAPALAGVEQGIFARNLGPSVTLQTATFNAGPAEVEALFSEAIDAAYVGPNPAINAYIRSKGAAIRVISGATSGGAFLVVKPDITGPQDLRGKKVASPQLGNTQDVALRTWLKAQGLRTDPNGGGDVSIVPQDNAQTLDTFRAGDIVGAWVPEPWATRLIVEGGAKVLVDERDLWQQGRYATTELVVRTAFMKQHPDVVEGLLRGQIEANTYVNSQPAEAQKTVNAALQRITGKALRADEIAAAWQNLSFTNDPIASSLRKAASDAAALGFLDLNGVNLAGMYDVGPLNRLLKASGNAEIQVQ
jgi:NitT/TauT family transport system substrate-binding protein